MSSSDNSKIDQMVDDFPPTHLELKHHTSEEIDASGKWYDRKILGFRYSDAMIQVVMLAFVVFLTPGMFNAISAVGKPISDVATSDNANVALYSTFASIGFFGGTICNVIGVKASLMFGACGYIIYTGSLLCFFHTENKGFVIFAGAFLGICAAVLWAAQGTIIMSYPTESTKGRAIMVFWVIFNLGAVIGSIIPLASNIHNTTSVVHDYTYVIFIVLMGCGICVAFLLLPMNKVWKSDNTRVIAEKHPYWKDELFNLAKLLWNEPKIFLMFPMFFASNWFYTYQFNDFNAGRFNLRTRSLNSLIYWLAQMVGAIIFGSILDFPKFSRSMRSKIGWCVLLVLGMAIWGGGYAFQITFTRDNVADLVSIDFTHGDYIGPMFLYLFYGLFDAVYQTFIYWTMGALSNNPKKVALYAGFYKGIQSAGAAIAWRLDAMEIPYMDMFASSWGLAIGGLLFCAPLSWMYITDHTDAEKDGMLQVVGDDELEVVKSQVEHKEDV